MRLHFGSCVSHFQAMVQLACAGIGTGIIPAPFLTTMPDADGIEAVSLDEDWAYKNVYICHRSGQALSSAASAALSFFRDASHGAV